MRSTLATGERIDGCHRKIAWFSSTANGISFELGRFVMGSHTTYHVDGNIFRTSPATGNRAKPAGNYFSHTGFYGWYQVGVSMVRVDDIPNNSCLKARDKKSGNVVDFLSVARANGPIVNLVLEFIDPDHLEWLNAPGVESLPNSVEYRMAFESVIAVVTAITDQNELLVWPQDEGFGVSHRNSRFSLNQPGVKYTYEAYG